MSTHTQKMNRKSIWKNQDKYNIKDENLRSTDAALHRRVPRWTRTRHACGYDSGATRCSLLPPSPDTVEQQDKRGWTRPSKQTRATRLNKPQVFLLFILKNAYQKNNSSTFSPCCSRKRLHYCTRHLCFLPHAGRPLLPISSLVFLVAFEGLMCLRSFTSVFFVFSVVPHLFKCL